MALALSLTCANALAQDSEFWESDWNAGYDDVNYADDWYFDEYGLDYDYGWSEEDYNWNDVDEDFGEEDQVLENNIEDEGVYGL